MSGPLRVRWLGRVAYREALDLQRRLCHEGVGEHLLLLEHDHVFTHGRHADLGRNLLCDPATVGAELVPVDRGGDITYHGPGQLTGYPIVTTESGKGSRSRSPGRRGGDRRSGSPRVERRTTRWVSRSLDRR